MWYFFFFKQKTAYEMRISDWSSDVCSSDLSAASPASGVPPQSDGAAPASDATVSPAPLFSAAWAQYCEDQLALKLATEGDLAHRHSSVKLWLEKIGRA